MEEEEGLVRDGPARDEPAVEEDEEAPPVVRLRFFWKKASGMVAVVHFYSNALPCVIEWLKRVHREKMEVNDNVGVDVAEHKKVSNERQTTWLGKFRQVQLVSSRLFEKIKVISSTFSMTNLASRKSNPKSPILEIEVPQSI